LSDATLPCLILAGGLGTRMRPSTDRTPKALLPVAGRPFAHWQLSWLATQGVERVVYSVGYLGEQIEAAVGDGGAWGLRIEYVEDGPRLLGTGGAVRRAIDAASLASFFVLYGDSYLRASLPDVATAFRVAGRPALMTVFHNRGRFEESNAHFLAGQVVRYGKGPRSDPEMAYVDYGLLAFDAHAITERVAAGQIIDLSDVCADLSLEGLLSGYEVADRFYEIGSRQGLSELTQFLVAPPGAPSARVQP
jgi:MurNAc alpha-1-phosphate uridylyltransferase